MISAPLPVDEARRLAALRNLKLLDTPSEERFDRLTRLAARLLQVPIALITLVAEKRQWFKSSVGLAVPETSRESSFCAHAILQEGLFVVPNALDDRRFFDNPLVSGAPHIRFYAGAPLRTRDGSQVGTLCVIDRKPRTLDREQREVLRDLADLAEAEINAVRLHEALDQLRESERWVRAIADNTPALIAYIDRDERYRFLNERYRDWFGVDPQAMIGCTMREMLEPEAYELARRRHAAALSGTPQRFENRLTIGDAEICADVRFTPHLAENGEALGVFVHVSDVTEIERAKQAAEQASVAKARFLANMSHEIRTPLGGILGVVDILLGKELGAEQRTLAETVQRSAQWLLRVVNEILDFSKVESGCMELERRTFDVRTVIDEVIRLHAPPAAAKGLTIRADAPDALPPAVGDDGRLGQVLSNLLSNAVKFTGQGEIVIGAQIAEESDHAVVFRFEVRDSGAGVPREAQERIFAEFTQADASTTRQHGGTGLGLAICRRIVSLMGGTIGVHSELGRGSTFHFTARLERAETLPPQRDAETTPAAPVQAAGLRALVADDSEINRFVAVHLLCEMGCAVDAADNGREAAQLSAQNAYDLILMDCQMPVLDGYAATAEIRRQPRAERRPYIVALTAHALPGERERCLEAGMDDYLSKPLQTAALARCVEAVRARQENTEAADAEAPAIDHLALSALLEEFGGSPRFLDGMITLFRKDAGQTMDALRAYAQAGDLRAMASACHKLRGSAANFGGARLQELCSDLETELNAGAVRQLDQRVERIGAELERMTAALEKERSRLGAA